MITKNLPKRICLVPRVSGIGGMVSFSHKLARGLQSRGISVVYDLADLPYDSILVIGGTRQLNTLWKLRRKGIPIVQRLDGINWLHRKKIHQTWSLNRARHYLRAEYGNLILSFIRRLLAHRIIYQSHFAKKWWESAYGATGIPDFVIHNGVDLATYHPGDISSAPEDRFRILLVEGNLLGGYELGLQTAVNLANQVAQRKIKQQNSPKLFIELQIVGQVAPELQRHYEPNPGISIHWVGAVPAEQVPELDRAAHLLFSSDINPACPNSVIEALACGLPVLAFDTGAIPELVSAGCGRVVPYGGDPWRLDPPDIPALADAACEIFTDQARLRKSARQHAEEAFGIDKMVDQYLRILDEG